ncbi:MAG: hypothetical protein A3F83_15050 [Candidatus Glassbacteria bacterium RIFCSPLOWO2_12_FULL_58_11]|uniref:Uncharacterized protein n=1 Tax=Candidatus Glassbacteria bacterium RIFCSPLOWO2_12_FULL_58_11 TaxID=1817867 RepID=A0A1F5YPI4_9BACT|nr:MAG: hypothetical protein A3F83_15050 [Candidatus Glassbacteria bacterium RIFCSPLOWO2_12_FULL_58_11]
MIFSRQLFKSFDSNGEKKQRSFEHEKENQSDQPASIFKSLPLRQRGNYFPDKTVHEYSPAVRGFKNYYYMGSFWK